MSILFVTSTRIGDAVLSTGILAHLLATRPDLGVTVACGPAAAPLFAAVPRLERVVTVAKRPGGGHWFDLWRAVAGRAWSIVVDLRGSALVWLIWARERRVLRGDDKSLHRVPLLASVLGLEADPPAPMLWSAADDRAAAAAALPTGGPILALGPTANWGGKQWPADRFAALAQRLTGPGGVLPGARVAIFGAAHERPMAEPLLAALPSAVDLVGRLSLPAVHAAFQRCAFYVGNDSGLMHMAAAAGIPTLGLFGPSREELYAPWGPRAASVRTDLTYDQILHRPGYDYRRHDTHMDTLSVDKACAAAEALWRRAA